MQGIAQYAEPAQNTPPESGVNYVDDSQIYDYDHQNDGSHSQSSNRPQSRAAQHDTENGYDDQVQYSRQGKDYYSYGRSEPHEGKEEDDDDDMW